MASEIELTLSEAGAEFIARFEGFKAEQYFCPAGFATIGYGHRLGPTDDIHHVTVAEALDLLRADADREAAPVRKALTRQPNQHEADALISLAFNCGGNAIARSTAVRLINEQAPVNQITGAWAAWNKAGGRISRGLMKRRGAELRLFLTGAYE